MADTVKELFPDIPTEEVDQYKITVWTYDLLHTQVYIRKICWEYHINTPYESVYPGERKGVAFTHQWCIRHNDRKHYEGRMREGWVEIFMVKGRFFHTESEAKQAAIDRLIGEIREKLGFIEACCKSIVEMNST